VTFELKGVGCPESLSKRVEAAVVRSKVSLSNDVVQFKKVFIYGGSSYDKNFTSEEVRVSNDTIEEIYWKLDIRETLKEKAFSINTTTGKLTDSVDDAITPLKFFFIPNETKHYESKVYLSIYDKDHKLIEPSPYKEITLMGEGTSPRIYFDKKEIIMPIVPLGFESKVRFKIINEGYDNTKLTYRWFCQNGPNIKVTFLDGEEIGMLRNELKMELYFVTNKPISFTGNLTFIDSDNRENTILVSGTCDNSLFTSFSFQQRQYENVAIEEENDGINLKVLKENENPDIGDFDDKKSEQKSQSAVSSALTSTKANIVGYQRISSKVMNNTCKYIKRYFNLVLPNSPIGEFPADIMKNHGEILFDFIFLYTGKAIPFKLASLDDDYGKSVIQIRNQYLELIKSLQSEGALLNTIFPEYLMEFKHYYKYLSLDKDTGRLLQSNWQTNKKRIKKAWAYINKESWIHLIYQILKIYYLVRVSTKSLKQSVKILKDEQQNIATNSKFKSSNVYSPQELILLRWVQAMVDNLYPNTNKKIINFSDDFLDGKAMTAILLAYLPNIEEEYKLSKKKNVPEHKYTINNDKILEIFNDYGVYSHMKAEYLSFPTARENLLFITMLFQNLQHFIPRDTLIFSCTLGDTILKSVNLANNTNKRIQYIIKKEGSDDFNIGSPHNLVSSEIKIDPNTPHGVDFNIAFKSRISAPVQGKIYFISTKNEGSSMQAAPLVFLLESKITSRRSIGQIYSFKSNLYRTIQIKFPVRSPIQTKDRVDYTIHLYQQKKAIVETKKKSFKQTLAKPTNNLGNVLYKVFFTKFNDDTKMTIRLDYDSKFNLFNYKFLTVLTFNF